MMRALSSGFNFEECEWVPIVVKYFSISFFKVYFSPHFPHWRIWHFVMTSITFESNFILKLLLPIERKATWINLLASLLFLFTSFARRFESMNNWTYAYFFYEYEYSDLGVSLSRSLYVCIASISMLCQVRQNLNISFSSNKHSKRQRMWRL